MSHFVKSSVHGCVKQLLCDINKKVNTQQPIIELSTGQDVYVVSSVPGILKRYLVKVGDIIDDGDRLFEIITCTHPAVFKGMCVSCGMKVDQIEHVTIAKTPVKTAFTVNGGHTMHLSMEEAHIVQQSKINALRKARKLALVLDLDHTLLHATAHSYHTPDKMKDTKLLTIIENGSKYYYYLQLRPHLEQFLEEVSNLFQLTIYTHGTRKYAEGVARLIDPMGTLFGKRIVSRTDQPDLGADKSLGRLFLGDWSMAVVVDDRDDVWKGAQQSHLITIMPFLHFEEGYLQPESRTAAGGINNSTQQPVATGTGEVNNAPGLHVNAENGTEKEDTHLLICLKCLKELHASYYSQLDAAQSLTGGKSQEPSVADILTSIKRRTLSGCVISFCGFDLPVNRSVQDQDPTQSPPIPIPTSSISPNVQLFAHLAMKLGATVELGELNERTTHVICQESSTLHDVVIPSTCNAYFVRSEWLLQCNWTLSRQSEAQFWCSSVSSAKCPDSLESESVLNANSGRNFFATPNAPTTVTQLQTSNIPSTTSQSTQQNNSQENVSQEDAPKPYKRRRLKRSCPTSNSDHTSVMECVTSSEKSEVIEGSVADDLISVSNTSTCNTDISAISVNKCDDNNKDNGDSDEDSWLDSMENYLKDYLKDNKDGESNVDDDGDSTFSCSNDSRASDRLT
jgi:FCP1-like phosphatase family protein